MSPQWKFVCLLVYQDIYEVNPRANNKQAEGDRLGNSYHLRSQAQLPKFRPRIYSPHHSRMTPMTSEFPPIWLQQLYKICGRHLSVAFSLSAPIRSFHFLQWYSTSWPLANYVPALVDCTTHARTRSANQINFPCRDGVRLSTTLPDFRWYSGLPGNLMIRFSRTIR